jgi:2'-5' RNA ligase
MSALLALDVAILPPSAIGERAAHLSAMLPAGESQGLRLDADHLPHVTLTQQFVRGEDLPDIFESLGEILRAEPPVTLHVPGGGKGAGSVWMVIERTEAISRLHARLMDALHEFECPLGTESAFVGNDPREGDLAWVSGYRRKSSFDAFAPHITLGHAGRPPAVVPLTFEATTIAACQLGRFCACRQILQRWQLR